MMRLLCLVTLTFTLPLAAQNAHADHRELNAREEHKCSDARGEANVRVRKGRGVGEKGHGGQVCAGSEAPAPREGRETQRPRADAHGREGDGVNAAVDECEAAQKGVPGKAKERERRRNGDAPAAGYSSWHVSQRTSSTAVPSSMSLTQSTNFTLSVSRV